MKCVIARCIKMVSLLRGLICVVILAQGLLSCSEANWRLQSDHLSMGLYRIPYEDKTQVLIIQDHRTHKPANRLDIWSVLESQDKPNRIVAAASGVVRYIVDEYDIQQDVNANPCNNNYVWLEHPNGEWTKYSHMQKDSVRKGAKLKVGDNVQIGTYLGDEGNVGCASVRHLHFEVAVPYNSAEPIIPTGGFIKGENLTPRICNIPEQTAIKGRRYTAARCLD